MNDKRSGKSLQKMSDTVAAMMDSEIELMMLTTGRSRSESTLIISQFVIGPAIAYCAAAMGKQKPADQNINDLVHKIIDLVGELP